MRYIFIILMVLGIFSIKDYDARNTLMSLLSGKTVGIILISIMVSFLGIALFFERPYCRFICPQGALYGMFSIIRPLTLKRSKNTCINCTKCNQACPMGINISAYESVGSPQCINCFNCVSSCPVKGTIKVGVDNPYSRIIKMIKNSFISANQ